MNDNFFFWLYYFFSCLYKMQNYCNSCSRSTFKVDFLLTKLTDSYFHLIRAQWTRRFKKNKNLRTQSFEIHILILKYSRSFFTECKFQLSHFLYFVFKKYSIGIRRILIYKISQEQKKILVLLKLQNPLHINMHACMQVLYTKINFLSPRSLKSQ